MNKIEYKFKDKKGKEHSIYVENSRITEDGPRKASGAAEKVSKELIEEVKLVSAMASSIIEELKRLQTSKLEVEFGVELGGKAGIPFVTEGTAKANFIVRLTWDKSK